MNFPQQNSVAFPEESVHRPDITNNLPELATPAEVAAILRCTKRHVQTECARGAMRYILVAGRYLITPDAVKDYLEERTSKCHVRTREQAFHGAKTGSAGRSYGLSEDADAAVRRALKTTEMLKNNSLTSLKKGSQSSKVIHLRG